MLNCKTINKRNKLIFIYIYKKLQKKTTSFNDIWIFFFIFFFKKNKIRKVKFKKFFIFFFIFLFKKCALSNFFLSFLGKTLYLNGSDKKIIKKKKTIFFFKQLFETSLTLFLNKVSTLILQQARFKPFQMDILNRFNKVKICSKNEVSYIIKSINVNDGFFIDFDFFFYNVIKNKNFCSNKKSNIVYLKNSVNILSEKNIKSNRRHVCSIFFKDAKRNYMTIVENSFKYIKLHFRRFFYSSEKEELRKIILAPSSKFFTTSNSPLFKKKKVIQVIKNSVNKIFNQTVEVCMAKAFINKMLSYFSKLLVCKFKISRNNGFVSYSTKMNEITSKKFIGSSGLLTSENVVNNEVGWYIRRNQIVLDRLKGKTKLNRTNYPIYLVAKTILKDFRRLNYNIFWKVNTKKDARPIRSVYLKKKKDYYKLGFFDHTGCRNIDFFKEYKNIKFKSYLKVNKKYNNNKVKLNSSSSKKILTMFEIADSKNVCLQKIKKRSPKNWLWIRKFFKKNIKKGRVADLKKRTTYNVWYKYYIIDFVNNMLFRKFPDGREAPARINSVMSFTKNSFLRSMKFMGYKSSYRLSYGNRSKIKYRPVRKKNKRKKRF